MALTFIKMQASKPANSGRTAKCEFPVDSAAPHVMDYIKEASSECLSHPEAKLIRDIHYFRQMLKERDMRKEMISREPIERKIFLIRSQKVMLDVHLARLYKVPTKSLNLAVKRNIMRFPNDFMFRLTQTEVQNLRFQIETSSWGGRRYLPYAFTEQGVAMLSSVLQSKRAVLVNIAIMRTFVRLRQILAAHKDLARKLEDLERKYDVQFRVVFNAIDRLMTPPEPPRKRIGFVKERRRCYASQN